MGVLHDEKLRAKLEAIRDGRENGRNPGGAADAAEELTKILALDTVDLRVTGAEIFGRGSRASANVHLSDGSTLILDPLGAYGSPAKLAVELALQTGAGPQLKAPMVVRALTLLHKIARHHEGQNKDAIVTDWGVDFLQTAQRHPVDMNAQDDRWRAFNLLASTDPVSASRAEGTSIARQSIVLEDSGGVRYVRCGWFLSFVRATAGSYSPTELASDMERVGWGRPGSDGRVKATAPGRGVTLAWNFYTVPADWEKTR